MVSRWVVAAVVSVGLWGAPVGAGRVEAKAKPKPTACPGGEWVIPGSAFVGGGGGPETIDIAGRQVSLGSGCPAVTARRIVSRRKTSLRAHWRTCGTERGGALTVSLDAATCESLGGVFKPRKGKPHRFHDIPVQVPAGSFGKAGGTPPPGFALVTKDEFDGMTGPKHPAGSDQDAADAAAASQLAMDDETLVTQFTDANPGMADHYSPGVDPNDGEVSQSGDGNYLVTVPVNQPAQTPGTAGASSVQQVVTLGRASSLALIANALRIFPTMDNQAGQYDSFYDFLTSNTQYSFVIDRLNLPTKAGAHDMPVSSLTLLNASIANYLAGLIHQAPPPGGTPPPGYPASCAAEENGGDLEDQTGGTCAHTSLGAYNNYFWPQKFYQTCVKNQGNRGTCVSCAMSGAMEAAIAKKYNRWVNLSEEHLYFMAKGVWWPSTYGDGLGSHTVWQRMIAENYVHPFENQWEYNPSYSRTANDMTQTYTHSCTGYIGPESAYCSDTVHQGYGVCYDFLLFRFCYYVAPPTGTGSGFRAVSETELWDSSNPDNSLSLILWAVALFGKPVMLGIPVPPSFDHPDANGYVTTVLPHCGAGSDGMCHPNPGVCECDRGGHAVLIVGWIDNTSLPMGAPAAPTNLSALDGGYLIIKNSWGKCFADAGYIYLPYRWVKNMAYSATVLGDIN